MLRRPENFRRVERRQVRPETVMLALKRCPGGIDDESREAEEDQQRLQPPAILAGRGSEASHNRQTGRRRSHSRLLTEPKNKPMKIPARFRLCKRSAPTSFYLEAGRRGRCFAEIDLMINGPVPDFASDHFASLIACRIRARTSGLSRSITSSSRIWRTMLPLPRRIFFGSFS